VKFMAEHALVVIKDFPQLTLNLSALILQSSIAPITQMTVTVLSAHSPEF